MSPLQWMVILLFGVWAFGALGNLFIQSSRISTKVSRIQILLAILPSFTAMLISISLVWLSNQHGMENFGWNWLTLGSTHIKIDFQFNKFTIPLLLIVNIISFLVHVFSVAYMKHNESWPRFFATLGLFTFSMLGLTLSGNLFQLFMCWELVGLSSYLLIGFYRAKPEAARAASKALIINKIGDAGFLIALMMLWANAGTLNIESLSTHAFSEEWRTWIGTAILIAVLAKSAQFPLHTWLPDAMVGPTPVSALIHSATMVAAGVFLLVRLQFLFMPTTLQLIAVLGGLTALIGGLNAIRENDLKRFLAWSTLSQLGLMTMVAGASAFNAAFMHLLSHAIFKAGLFLGAGVLIQHYQIKSFTDHVRISKALRAFILLLTLALMGMPLTIGFLSKEIMLGSVQSPIIAMAMLALSFVTAFYCARLLVFIKPEAEAGISKISLLMLIPVGLMATASIWVFYTWSPFEAKSIQEIFTLTAPSLILTLISIAAVLLGITAGIGVIRQGKLSALQKLIPIISYERWLISLFVKPVLALSQVTARADYQIDRSINLIVYAKVSAAHIIAWVDQNIVDGTVHGLAWLTKTLGNIFRKLVTGKIQDYIWWTILALIVILLWFAQ